MTDIFTENSDQVSSSEKPLTQAEKARQLVELDELAKQFLNEGKLSQEESDEIASMTDPVAARERFLEISKGHYELAKNEQMNEFGGYRMDSNIDFRNSA